MIGSRLRVWCVLGLMTACAPSDEEDTGSLQDNIENGGGTIYRYDAGYGGGIATDAGSVIIRRDSGFPPPAPPCDHPTEVPRCAAPRYVDKCMPQARIETLVLDMCGDQFVGGTTIPAGSRACEFGTDAAWVVCCYGDSGPIVQGGGGPAPERQDAGAVQPKDASVFGDERGTDCTEVGAGVEYCADYEELAVKLSVMCKEQGRTLGGFIMDVVGKCSQGYGHHMVGQCCASWQ
ncbi:MAG TPA: hypothetical protein VI299_09225 [Polyangiales bacterium]